MLAARHGHDDVVLVLMKGQQGASVNLQNSRGDSALSLAAGAGKDDAVELLLLKRAQPDQANHGGRTPLAEAAAGGHLATASLLIANNAQVNAGAGAGEPALTVAAQAGDGALVGLLLEKKASPDSADRYGWTAFNHAASRGHQAVMRQLQGHGATAGRASSTAQEAPTASALPGPAAVLPPAPQASSTVIVEGGNATPLGSTRTTAITDTTTTTVVVTRPAYAAPAMSATPAGSAAAVLTSLRKAVESNDLEALNQIVTAHPDDHAMLNQPIAFERRRGLLPAGSYTLLMLAAAHGHAPMVEALLALGADANARGSDGMSALLLAVRHRQIGTVDALLKAGAEVDAQAEDGNTAVMLALARRDANVVKVLLEGVSNPEDASACLRQAAARGYVNTVRLLIKAGADVNGFDDVKGKKKGIPSHESMCASDYYYRQQYAHYYDSQGVLNPFAEQDWAESLALSRAARNGHATTVQALLDAGARVDRGYCCQQLMLDAVTNRRIDIMRMLLEARQRAPYPSQYISSHSNKDYHDCIAKDMHEAFTWAISRNDDDDLTLFQALLAMPNGEATVLNDPALLPAALRRCRPAMAKALLDADANPNKPYFDQYPIVLAVQTGDPALARKSLDMLLKAGALPELARQHGKDKATLLEHAMTWGNVELIQYVLSLGAEACGDKGDISAALLKAWNGLYDLDKIQLLLDAGADANWKSADGQTPLAQAACFGKNDGVELLLRHQAQVDLPGKYGSLEWTPLMAAAYNGRTDTVRLLLEAGANRNLKDSEGKTALHRVIERNQKEMVDLLRNWKPSASS
jgi:ankyrin repeat protein